MGNLKGSLDDRDRASFVLDIDTDVSRRVVSALTVHELFNISTIEGLTSGESFDKIESGVNGFADQILEFSLAGVCQFQLLFSLTSSTVFTILKRACEGPLLQEDGFNLLQENGDKLLAEGLF